MNTWVLLWYWAPWRPFFVFVFSVFAGFLPAFLSTFLSTFLFYFSFLLSFFFLLFTYYFTTLYGRQENGQRFALVLGWLAAAVR